MYSMDILKMVLEKFHAIPFTNKKVACRRPAIQHNGRKLSNSNIFVVKLLIQENVDTLHYILFQTISK